jgi:hypothetical protein
MSNIFIGIAVVVVLVVVGGREGGRKGRREGEEGWSYGSSFTMKALLYDGTSTHPPVLLLPPLPPPSLPPPLPPTIPPLPTRSSSSRLLFGVISVSAPEGTMSSKASSVKSSKEQQRSTQQAPLIET